jgi:hypothetical protein
MHSARETLRSGTRATMRKNCQALDTRWTRLVTMRDIQSLNRFQAQSKWEMSASPCTGAFTAYSPTTMNAQSLTVAVCIVVFLGPSHGTTAHAGEPASLPKAWIDGTGPDWRQLGEQDFANVNCNPDTWTWKDDGVACTGQPVGVTRSKTPLTNFELVAQWRLLSSGGNSGIFVWTSEAALQDLKPGTLPPGGFEVQVLDHGYTEQYEKASGKKADWFTTDGDVFPVGTAKWKPFPPTSPNGERSFPRKKLSKSVGEWNHYYVRAIDGEIRLWVNGEEVSGGGDCNSRSGYLCLESEGAPVEFKELRLRELP